MLAIEFKDVVKTYPLYHHITSGLKNFILNLPKAAKELRQTTFTSLDGISFQINKGEAVAFIGSNGAGKSTTLGLIAGVLRPNSGSVTVNQRVSPLLELGGGFHPDLTGLENIQLNGVLLGLSRKEVEQKKDSIIAFSELGEFINQPIRTYSSGMMTRLAFSVVAHLDPELLLIDEVLAVGDAKFRQKCQQKIADFKAKGVTIVLVSHNPSDILSLCERAIWIQDHKVKMDGPATEVLKIYQPEV